MDGFVLQFLIFMIVGAAVTGILLNAMLLIALSKIKTTRTSYFALVKSLIVGNILLPSNFTVIVMTNKFVLYEYLVYVIFLVHLKISYGVNPSSNPCGYIEMSSR